MSRGVYTSPEALKRTLSLASTTFADYDIDPAIASASRAVDEYCGRYFDRDTEVPQVRWYRPVNPSLILVDDFVDITELITYQLGPGSTSRTWRLPAVLELDPPETPEVSFEPLNAIPDGFPFTRITLNPFRPSIGFPSWAPQSAKVTGLFGWPALPDQVVTATTLLAARVIKRVREAPFGVAMQGMDVGAAMRISRTDPDVCALLAPYVREKIVSHL